MAGKKKTTKKRDPNQIVPIRKPGHTEADSIAHTVLQPTVQAAVTVKAYTKNYGELELHALHTDLIDQVNAIKNGDLKYGEAVLASQAHTLDAMFNRLAQLAMEAEYLEIFNSRMKMALRAQSQCRSTLEALGTIKNPPLVTNIKQANIAQGHLQVINDPATEEEATHPKKKQNSQNKLMEKNDGEWLDTRTTGTTSQYDKKMEAMEEVDRPKNTGRKKSGRK